MTRSSRWSPLAVLAATAAIVFAACGGTTAITAPSSGRRQHRAERRRQRQRQRAVRVRWPTRRRARPPAARRPPGRHPHPYAGEFKKISAPDARTVVFDLCGSDVAFLSKIAFTSFAINDAGWLTATSTRPPPTPEDRLRGQRHRRRTSSRRGTAART